MMVTTVTLNPALDYHITLPGLAPGEIQWFSHSSFSPGGKGINVSLLLSSLGVETWALGIAAGFTGREIARLLEERGCPADMVFLEEGCSRVNVKLQTPGGEETARMLDFSREMLRGAGYLPYYLYRQKNMTGNLENVGYAREGCYGLYNILIMEEKQSIMAIGAGTISKAVHPDGRIERCENVKELPLYLEKIDEMIERKRRLLAYEG